MVGAGLHIPNFRRVDLWNFPRRRSVADSQLRHIKILDCWLILCQCLCSFHPIFRQMVDAFNRVAVHGSGMNKCLPVLILSNK